MIQDLYDRTITLYRSTLVRNTYGEEVFTYSSVASIVCAIQTRSGTEQVSNGVQRGTQATIMYCNSTEDVQFKDIILDDSNYSTSYYEVTLVNNNLRGNHLQIEMERYYGNFS
jgi:head-tail adaptor